jgi:lipopolysaccharide/colanic/teichoic acid biosynthesis glycosyltransferase
MFNAKDISDTHIALSNRPLIEQLRASRMIFNGIVIAVALLVCTALALVYYAIAWPQTSIEVLDLKHHVQVLITIAANLAAIAIALALRGPMNARIITAMMYVCVLHGAIIAAQFGFRLYYSRAIVFAGVLASLTLVVIVLMCVERYRPQRVGVITDGLSAEYLPWLGRHASLIEAPNLPPRSFDIVLVNWSHPLDQRWNSFVSEAILSGVSVRHLFEYIEDIEGRVSPEHFKPKHADSVWLCPYKRVFKRILDIVLCVLVLPIAVPIILLSMIAILMTMGRPLLFIQDRVGHCGRIFRIYKLRTMTNTSAAPSSATQKGDRRVTPTGHILRRFRFDELPQIFNVLKGDMSIVGPRPEQPELTRRYLAVMPAFRYRNLLPPGITGWAQVRAGYASDEAETREKLMHDLYYVKNASPLLDLRIIATTARTVLFGRGSR